MDEYGFGKWWLIYEKKALCTAEDYLSRISRLINEFNCFDIDDEFSKDQCESFLNKVKQAHIQINKSIYENGVAAINAYIKYKKWILNRIVKIEHNREIKYHSGRPIINTICRGLDNDVGYVSYDKNINVSNRIPGLTEYIDYQYASVREFLSSIFNDEIHPIPIILCEETPYKEYFNDNKTIAKFVKKAVDEKGGKISEKQILDIIEKPYASLRILGEYHPFSDEHYPEGPHIVIYYNNFGTNYKNNNLFYSNVSMTIAHEYMHYYHHTYVGTKRFEENTSLATKVKEAVADFFSVLFLSKKQGPHNSHAAVALARNLWWEQYFDTDLPYAEARWCLYSSNNWITFKADYDCLFQSDCVYKLSEVIISSKNSWEDGYFELHT